MIYILIFGLASLNKVLGILATIEQFFQASRQTINFAKSQIIAANNLPAELEHFMFLDKGFIKVVHKIQYFRFPYIQNARHSNIMNSLILKISNNISSWTLKPLSQTIKLIMIKSVLLFLTIYLMSCTKFLSTLLIRFIPSLTNSDILIIKAPYAK